MKKRFTVSDIQDASEILNYLAQVREETKTLKKALEQLNEKDRENLLAIAHALIRANQ